MSDPAEGLSPRRAALTVPEAAEGAVAIDFLTNRFRYLSADGWLAELAAGRVSLDGRPLGPADGLIAGGRLVWRMTAVCEPPVNTRYRLLHEDDHLLAVDKPANLPCHPSGRYYRHTLWALLRERGLGGGCHFVHRLDRETSGVVLIAKDRKTARRLGEMLQGGRVEKRYLAVVEGSVPGRCHRMEGWIGPDAGGPVRMRRRFAPLTSWCAGGEDKADGADKADRVDKADQSAETDGAERANGPERAVGEEKPVGAERCDTHFAFLWRGRDLSLVMAAPGTGRRHQIRATLLAMGCPVAGDKLYGPDPSIFERFIADEMTDGDRRRLRIGRQALHAWHLAFRHPESGAPIRLRAPLPLDLRLLLTSPCPRGSS